MSESRVEENFPNYNVRRRAPSPSTLIGVDQEMLQPPPRREIDLTAVKDKIKKKKKQGGLERAENDPQNVEKNGPEEVKPAVKQEVPEIIWGNDKEEDGDNEVVIVKLPRKRNRMPIRAVVTTDSSQAEVRPGTSRNASDEAAGCSTSTRINSGQQDSSTLPITPGFSTPFSSTPNGQVITTPEIAAISQVSQTPNCAAWLSPDLFGPSVPEVSEISNASGSSPEVFTTPQTTPSAVQDPLASQSCVTPRAPPVDATTSSPSDGQDGNGKVGEPVDGTSSALDKNNAGSSPEVFTTPQTTPSAVQVPLASHSCVTPRVPPVEAANSSPSDGQDGNVKAGEPVGGASSALVQRNAVDNSSMSGEATRAQPPESQTQASNDNDVQFLSTGSFEFSSRGIELRFPPEFPSDIIVQISCRRQGTGDLPNPPLQPESVINKNEKRTPSGSDAGRSGPDLISPSATLSAEGADRKRASDSSEDKRDHKKPRHSGSHYRSDHSRSHGHRSPSGIRHHSSHEKSRQGSSSGHSVRSLHDRFSYSSRRSSHRSSSSSVQNDKGSSYRSSSSSGQNDQGSKHRSSSSSAQNEKGSDHRSASTSRQNHKGSDHRSASISGQNDTTNQHGTSPGQNDITNQQSTSSRPHNESVRDNNAKKGPVFKTEVELIKIITNCEECGGLKFKTRREAVAHKKTKHDLKHCPVCFLLLSCKGNTWKDHLTQVHSNGREETAACPFCKKALEFSGMYCHVGRAHLISHEENGILRNELAGPPVLIPNEPTGSQPVNSTNPQPSTSKTVATAVVSSKAQKGRRGRPRK